MQNCTQTEDNQWQQKEGYERQAFKPFPRHKYFEDIVQVWENESVIMLEKSRTMMLSWTFAGLSLHRMMTKEATRALIFTPDEKRSVDFNNMMWTLYERQDEALKQIWPLSRPRSKQRYNVLELANHSSSEALPGKDPDKIRAEHPDLLIFDEAELIEKFGEALSVGMAARPTKIVAITSAYPGEFRDFTKPAEPIAWPYV
jgi:hypothetical protein